MRKHNFSLYWFSLCWLLSISLFTGCEKESTSIEEDRVTFLKDEALVEEISDTLPIPEAKLICQIDSLLILEAEDGVFAYDYKRNRNFSTVSLGQGPKEVVDITSVGRCGKSGVWHYDGNVGKGILYDIQNHSDSVISSKTIRILNELQPIGTSHLIGAPYGGKNGFYLYNSNGTVKLDSLDYFPPKPKGVSEWTHAMACSGTIAVANDGQHFARSVSRDGGIDFFKRDDDKIEFINRFSYFDPVYNVTEDEYPVPYTSEKSQIGFFSLTYLPDNSIAALFSEAKIKECNPFSSQWIYIFSPNGKLKSIYHSPKSLYSIASTPNSNSLWGITSDPTGENQTLVKVQL